MNHNDVEIVTDKEIEEVIKRVVPQTTSINSDQVFSEKFHQAIRDVVSTTDRQVKDRAYKQLALVLDSAIHNRLTLGIRKYSGLVVS